MQVTPILTLYQQASKLGKAPKKMPWGDARFLRSIDKAERVDIFEHLVTMLGGTLFTLFDKNGNHRYAVAENPMQAADYLHRFGGFVASYYSTERTRSCGGVLLAREIHGKAIAQNRRVNSWTEATVAGMRVDSAVYDVPSYMSTAAAVCGGLLTAEQARKQLNVQVTAEKLDAAFKQCGDAAKKFVEEHLCAEDTRFALAAPVGLLADKLRINDKEIDASNPAAKAVVAKILHDLDGGELPSVEKTEKALAKIKQAKKSYPDPSAERDAKAMRARLVEDDLDDEPYPPKVVEHPLQRMWPVNAFGRW